MWSDLLYVAERAHLARLLAWGGGSVLAATVILLVLAVRRARSPLLLAFALATAAWGATTLVRGAVGLRGLAMRDLDGFTRMDRLLWLSTGLDIGFVATGVALAIAGWVLGRSLPLVGAGLALLVQGLAHLVLDGTTLSVLGRLTLAG